jgi:hypothetical protein
MTAGYTDPVAELAVVACAVDNDHASRLAHTRLTASQFADVALAALFAITPDLPIIPPDHQTDPWQPLLWQTRAQQAARLTGLPHAQVLAVLEQRAVMHDLNGHYARRVASAALIRRQRAELVEALQLLDAGDHDRFEHTITRIAYHDTASTP